MAVRRRHIRALAESLLEKERIKSAPIDSEALARKLGMTVRYQAGEDDLSGFIVRDHNTSAAVIGVNSRHHKNRQRFTIAHEIGHFLLHEGEQLHIDEGRRGFQINRRDGKSSEGTSKSEIEANLFAAELLMPEKFLVQDVAKLESRDLLDEDVLDDLARKYQVSVTALTWRLNYLGYISE